MPSVAYHGSENAVEHETHYLDIATASKLAAESALPKLKGTSATPSQQNALVEAIRLVLTDEPAKARSVLEKGGFSYGAVEQIFPLLLSGLRKNA